MLIFQSVFATKGRRLRDGVFGLTRNSALDFASWAAHGLMQLQEAAERRAVNGLTD